MFESYVENKPNYPVDIKMGDECLCFDIACVGLKKKDIDITTEGNLLKVVYKKPSIESNPSDIDACEYIHKGITRKSFDMGWKISPKYDLTAIEAHMEAGLLTLTIPTSEDCLPKTVIIK
jgi:HSP20 family molecular chaperone IbpA